MSSEELDKKIIEAADHHNPPFDENAWKNMEKLLDIHLPQKKEKKRRILFFLLLLALLTGGGWFLSLQNGKNNRLAGSTKPVEKTEGKIEDARLDTAPLQGKVEASEYDENSVKKVVTPGLNSGGEEEKVNKVTKVNNVDKVENVSTAGRVRTVVGKKNIIGKMVDVSEDKTSDKTKSEKLSDPRLTAKDNPALPENKTSDEKKPDNHLVNTNEKKELSDVTANKKETTPETAAVKTAQKTKNKKQGSFSSGFVFSVSTGPDVSAVGTHPGKVKLLAGAGVGYVFNRLSVRTGFYTARKIYTAGRDEYYPDQPIPYPYLDHIDANCKVYEVPLTLAYQLNKKGKNNYYVSAGASSYFMKKETYDYVYKYPSGSTYTHTTNIDNENKNIFSVISLSGGVSRQITPAIGIAVEPYLKLPVEGVGHGNIRLNSGGVMISLHVKPFK